MSAKKKTAEKKTTKASDKKPNLKDMNQTHGMVEGQKYEPTTLDQVWGDDGLSKYQTMDSKVYEAKVSKMLLADLKNEAIRVGLLPVDNSEMLKDRLMREFTIHTNSYRRPTEGGSQPPQISEDIEDILKEGR
tara:strand:+ start:183 stop:581 length:399 start_codon:yes stop_codon:yes gene_type:complete